MDGVTEVSTEVQARRRRRPTTLRDVAQELVERHAPGGELLAVSELGADTVSEAATLKAIGYGRPLRLSVRTAGGERVSWVLHTATANAFGHDRRADRVADMVLAYDTFGAIPDHVKALDVGLVGEDGSLVSVSRTGEAYLVTTWAEGHIYADELRSVAERGRACERDLDHAARLGRYLARLHRPLEQAHAYERSVRDLLGSGEGIFGIVDGYPAEVPAAPPSRLWAIERRCLDWRWRLKAKPERLVRIHGDFHPFNLVFADDSSLSLLDASRGSAGDAADDLTALSVNYVFFGLQTGTWRHTFAPLWNAFWSSYQEDRRDIDAVALSPPYFTWRALVLSNPAWYPDIAPSVRDRLLTFAERALAAERFTLELTEELFR